MTKPTKWHVHPMKNQISLGIQPAWSESSLCAQWVAKNPSFLHADSEDSDQTGQMPRLIWVSKDSDQTGRMPRLIWVFTGHTCHFVGFVMRWLISCSFVLFQSCQRCCGLCCSGLPSHSIWSMSEVSQSGWYFLLSPSWLLPYCWLWKDCLLSSTPFDCTGMMILYCLVK